MASPRSAAETALETSSGPTEAQHPASKVPRRAGAEEEYALPAALGRQASFAPGEAPTEGATTTSSSSSPGTTTDSSASTARTRSDRGAFSRRAAAVPPLPEDKELADLSVPQTAAPVPSELADGHAPEPAPPVPELAPVPQPTAAADAAPTGEEKPEKPETFALSPRSELTEKNLERLTTEGPVEQVPGKPASELSRLRWSRLHGAANSGSFLNSRRRYTPPL